MKRSSLELHLSFINQNQEGTGKKNQEVTKWGERRDRGESICENRRKRETGEPTCQDKAKILKQNDFTHLQRWNKEVSPPATRGGRKRKRAHCSPASRGKRCGKRKSIRIYLPFQGEETTFEREYLEPLSFGEVKRDE